MFLPSFVSRRFCRVGLGCLAIVPPTTRYHVAATFGSSAGDEQITLQAVKNLVYKLHEPRHRRSIEKSTGRVSSSDENNRRSELADIIYGRYQQLPPLKLPPSEDCERTKIIMFLAMDCLPNDDSLQTAVDKFVRNIELSQDSSLWLLHSTVVSNLRNAATPKYEKLVRFILRNNSNRAISFLVAMREDLLQALRWMKSFPDDARLPHLKELDIYLKDLFRMWFSPGMLGEATKKDFILVVKSVD